MAVVGIASVLLAAPARTDLSTANWADVEYSHTTLTATVIQPPLLLTCGLNPGFLGLNPVVTVTWRWPALNTYSTPTNVAYFVAPGGLNGNKASVSPGTNLSTTGPVTNVYTTHYNSGLFGGLLGSSYGIFLQTVLVGSTWTSVFASATASAGLAGINPTCVITPP